MKCKTTEVGGAFTILAADDYTAIPISITGSSVIKAGTPITSAGAAGTASTGIGVLLYDVDPTINPNGALVVKGVIDAVKAKAHSNVDLTGISDKVPGIVLRSNIGVNE